MIVYCQGASATTCRPGLRMSILPGTTRSCALYCVHSCQHHSRYAQVIGLTGGRTATEPFRALESKAVFLGGSGALAMQFVLLWPVLRLSWPPHAHEATQLPALLLTATRKDVSCQPLSEASSPGRDGNVPAQKGNFFFLSCTVSTPAVLLSSNLIPLFSASFNAPNAAPASTAAPTTTFRMRPPLQGMPGCVSKSMWRQDVHGVLLRDRMNPLHTSKPNMLDAPIDKGPPILKGSCIS